jgi:hypothetical protein
MRQRTATQLTDAHLAAYAGWREACRLLDDAYRSWTAERGSGATIAFARYAAALDAEERAATAYAALVRRAGASIATDRVASRY